MKPGDVRYYHGAQVVVVRDDSDIPTPSGRRCRAVLIERKRKGLVWVPPETLSEAPRAWRTRPEADPAAETFGAPGPRDARPPPTHPPT